jgi:hypothetical protein
MKFTKKGVRYWFDTFEHLKPFEVVPYQDVVDLYLKNQDLLQYEKNNWGKDLDKLGGDNERPINSDVEKVDPDAFWLGYNPRYYDIDPYGKKVTQAKADVVSMDMAGLGTTWDNFIYLELPQELFKKYQKSVHSNPDISIYKKFIKELEKTDFSKEESDRLEEEFDKRYPDTHSFVNFFDTKIGPAWKADLDVRQYVTLKNKGIIYPICYNNKKYMFKRGTHRAFFLAMTGSDVPIFLQYPKKDFKLEDINPNDWNVEYEYNFGDKNLTMNINVKDKKLSFYLGGKFIGDFK